MEVLELQKKAARMREMVLMASSRAKYGFVGSCMSVMDILVALYFGSLGHLPVMRYDRTRPGWEGQDYLVLSKGHAALAQYAILADLGFFDAGELDHYLAKGSYLKPYPNLKVPGISLPVLSHGAGLGMAVGAALSVKMQRGDNRVFAVLSDGELQQGAIWEAAMAAAHYKLNNLVAFIDNNDLQLDGSVRAVMDIHPLQDKFEAFGWKVIQVRDGHDFDQLLDGLQKGFSYSRQPVCIWCHTMMAKGIPFAEGKRNYQDTVLSEPELVEAVNYLKSIYA